MKSSNPANYLMDLINEQQNEYHVDSFLVQAKHPIFRGFKRINPNNQGQGGEQNKESFVLKIHRIHSQEEKDKIERANQILHLFSNDPRVVQNEQTFEINTSDGTYIIVPTKYYPKRDVHEYLFSNPKGVDILETIRVATFQALHILNLLKTKHVIHNDFIFENLIVTEDPITSNSKLPFNVLVIDFANA